MSETFQETRSAISRLKNALRGADEDTRWQFGFWVFGLATMAFAIIAEFGFRGVIFCGGLVIWKTANHQRHSE